MADKQSALAAIADECKLPRSTFELRPDGELRFHVDPETKYESVGCALQRAKKLKGLNLGFVGIEASGRERD